MNFCVLCVKGCMLFIYCCARLGGRICDRIGARVCVRVGVITTGEDYTLFGGEVGARLGEVIYDDDQHAAIFFCTSQ